MGRTGFEAVLLDMDGTLVDSTAAVERAWCTWAGRYGVSPSETLALAHGAPAEQTIRRLLPCLAEADVQAGAAYQLALQYEDLSDVSPAAGAVDLLAHLDGRRVPRAVVTNADTRLARARLNAAGITAPVLVTRDDVRVGKPDPRATGERGPGAGASPPSSFVPSA